MNMLLVAYVLLVDYVGVDALGAETPLEAQGVAAVEGAGELVHELFRVVGEEE